MRASSRYRPTGTLALAFHTRRGWLARGPTIARIPMMSAAVGPRRRVAWRYVRLNGRPAPLGPIEDLAAVIDDAAAVAAGGRTFSAPAQIVKRTRLDTKELRGLRDGEKGGIVIVEHEGPPEALTAANLDDPCRSGEVQFAAPSD